MGWILESSLHNPLWNMKMGSFWSNPLPFLDFTFVHQGGVKVKSDEEKCPKTPSLTLTGALKAPVGSEEGGRREKIRKRKRAKAEVEPKD